MIPLTSLRQQLTKLTVKNFLKSTCRREFQTLKCFNESNSIVRSFPTCSSIRYLARASKRDNNQKDNKNVNNDNDDNSSSGESECKLLMNFVPRGMPNFFYSIKNFYIINFVIGTQVDKSFNFSSFIAGAKHALVTVSGHLAHNQLDNLEGLVHKEALKEIKKNYEKLSVTERNELQIQPSDIVLSFAHNINVETLNEGFTGTNKHIVKIFMVFDCVRNLEDILRDKANQGANPYDVFGEFQQKKFVCNYEFTREYIEGEAKGDWIITKLLHIREKDLLNLFIHQ